MQNWGHITISKIEIKDIRFPTSTSVPGCNFRVKKVDFSTTFVELVCRSDKDKLDAVPNGTGLIFTLG